MAKLTGLFGDNGFDPSSAEAAQGFTPLPTDIAFHFEIGEADLVETTKGGTMLKLRCNVLGPSHINRVVFANLNIQNANAQAEAIAASQLKMVCEALGIAKLEDTDELLGGQFLAHCRTRPAKDGYDAQSELDFATITALGEATQMPAKPAKPAAAAAAKAATPGKAAAKAPPWANKGAKAA